MSIEEKIMTMINYLDTKIETGNITRTILWHKYESRNGDYFIIYAENKGEIISHQIFEDIFKEDLHNSSTRFLYTIWIDDHKEIWRKESTIIYEV